MSLHCEYLKPQEFIKKYNAEYADSKPQNVESFKAKVKQYLESLDKHKKQNEKAIVANVFAPFLEKLGFQTQAAYKHKGNSEIDLALLKDDNVEIIIETKKPENAEMFSTNNPNCKALHECILYYLREREENNNVSLKYIIITNFTQFFIFEAKEFKKVFEKNKKIQEAYKALKNKGLVENQKDFYNELSKILNTESGKDLEGDTALQGTFFDLRNDKHLEFASKILSREFLHNEFKKDSNALNSQFYFELLHILGLKETNEKGKILNRNRPKSKNEFREAYRSKTSIPKPTK